MTMPIEPSLPQATNITLKQHTNGTWDFYIYDGGNYELMCSSDQGYVNHDDCYDTAWRVIHAGGHGTVHFTTERIHQ